MCNWYPRLFFVLNLYLVVIDNVDTNRIRHQKKNRVRSTSKINTTTGMIHANDYQSNPPQIVEADDLTPYKVLTISEINLDSYSPTSKRFIEINVDSYPGKIVPPFKNLLEGWRLLLVRGATMDIFMSIDLSAVPFEESKSKLLVGDNMVPNVNVVIGNDKTETCMDECLLDLDASPFAIILLLSMNIVPHDILTLNKQRGKYEPMNILNDEVKQQLFVKYTWDIAVVGRKVPTNQCDFFSSLFPSRSFKDDFKYLLRDRDSPTSSVNDYSLNYCCQDFIHYSPECFKLGHPSPGYPNDCTGKRFIVETVINSIQKSRMSSFFVDVNSPLCKADFPAVPAYRYAVIHDHDYAAAVSRVMQRSQSCQRDDYPLGIDAVLHEYPPKRIIVDTEDTCSNELRKYVDEFDVQSFRSCQHIFSRPEELLKVTFTCWIAMDSKTCKITCRICQAYFQNGYRPDKKNKSNIQSKGFRSKKKYPNQRAVDDHLKDETHLEAAHFFESLKSAKSREEQTRIEFLKMEEEKARLQPTMNEMKLAYIELRARVSFRSHQLFMDGVSKLNVNVGFKHRTTDALRQICTTLSSSFHIKLLKWLVKSDLFFSLICDGTTNRNVPYLVCLIQTIEENVPIVYYWGLFVITTGENGYNMVEDLKIRIASDDGLVAGFEEFFKRRIIAFVSDSASNMAGISNSFYTHLMHYISRDIALVKCGAHKLQRAILHGIDFPTDEPKTGTQGRERERYFKSFTKINNQFYSFYMSRGSKRFQEFVELAEELDLHAYRIHYFFDVRWAASHKRCMETLYRNYDALFADLSRISGDEDFDDSGKKKARELLKHLKDKTFGVVVAEFVDMLTVFKTMSERFQSKGGIMAGNVGIIRDGYQDIQFLQSQPGSYLREFLNKCTCEQICAVGECSLEQYDECPEVVRNSDQRLLRRTDGIHTISLSAFRSQLYNNLLQQLVQYFDPQLLEAFEIFNPLCLRDTCQQTSPQMESILSVEKFYLEFQSIVPNTPTQSARARLKRICKFYGLTSSEEIQIEWTKFLEVLTADLDAMKLRGNDAASFWSAVLAREDLQITSTVRDLIIRILTTSFTSADAERAFSMVSNIKTPDRSSLSPTSLENLVRIAFNGPDILSEESIFEYTKDFVKVSSRVDDPTTIGGRPAKPEAYKSFFSKSRLF